MPENYFVDCECGSQLRVELFHAGMEKVCPSCSATIRVPSSIELKELSGDKYPFLRPIEKIQRTAQSGEPPFNGVCHGCNAARATYATPCCFDVMMERHVADDGGLRPTLSGGIKLVAAASEEMWQSVAFPLLLCEQCQTRFRSDRNFTRAKAVLGFITLLGLLAAFLYFVYQDAELVAALSGVLWLIGAIAWGARFRDTRKLDPFLTRWLQNIRWVPEAIAGEDEFTLTIGHTIPLDAPWRCSSEGRQV